MKYLIFGFVYHQSQTYYQTYPHCLSPSIQFCSYRLDVRSQHRLHLSLVTFRPSQHILYHNVLRQVTTASCHLLLHFVMWATQLFGEGSLIQLILCDLPRGSRDRTEAGSARIRRLVIQFAAILQVAADETTDKVCTNATAG